MDKAPILKRLVSQPTEESFEKQKVRLIVQVLIVSSLVIFSLETFLMVFLEFSLVLPEPIVVFLDGLVLIIFLFPINYFLIVHPLSRQIEEHHKTNLELTRTNEILERFFALSDILIAYLDADFNFIRVNQAYALTDERSPDWYAGKNHFTLFPNEENRAIFKEVVRTGKPYYAVEKPFEYPNHPERGVTYWDWSLLPVKNYSNEVIALIFVLTNVTERKRAQMALQESERRFRAVFNQTFQHSAILDPQGTVLHINQTALDFSRMPPSEMIGIPLWLVSWWDDPTATAADLQAKIRSAVSEAANGKVVRFEHRIRPAQGHSAFMDITIKPLNDDQGTIIFLIYEARDITEYNRAEEALKRSEAEIKRLYLAEKNSHQIADTLRSAAVALSGSLVSEVVLKTLLDHLLNVIPYTSAHILLLDDEDHLVVRLAHGEEDWSPVDRLYGKKFLIESLHFLQPLLKGKEILTVPDTLLYHGALFMPTHEHVRCWLGIPLLAGEQIVGLCLLEHICPDFFTDDLVQWATALTGQAAIAIQNAWLFEQVRDGREQLQALSRRLVEVQENERLFIARELHDEAGQALASLMIGLRHLEHDSGDQPAVIAHCHELKDIADGVLENLHRLAINLRPAALDHLGLVAALRQHAEMISYQHNLAIQFATIGKIERLPGEVETAVYRIVQETLTNVVRHAQANRVDILLEKRNNHLVVIVEDNGVGFDAQQSKTEQLGVLGMRERAEMLGGKITIESLSGKGSSIILEVPCQFVS